MSSTAGAYVAWGGSSHAQNATGTILSAGSTLSASNSAILQDVIPLVIDMQRLVPASSTFTIAVQRFTGTGNATVRLDYSTDGLTWNNSGSGTGVTGWNTGAISTSATSSTYISKTVPTGGLRYVRITSTSSPGNTILIDGVQATHHCPIAVSSTRATRSFFAPGTNKGTLATNVFPANAQSLTYSTITAPSNGTWTLNSSTGAYTYTPNLGYDGIEVGVFRVFDGSTCDQDTFILRSVFNCDTNVFYAPISENQSMDFLRDIDRSGAGNNPPLNVYMGISVSSDAIVVFDHWEDGFESNPRNLTQSTSQIWGDGDLSNGIAPGTSDDILRGGTVMILQNRIIDPATTSGLNIVDYDGRDKVFIHGIGAMSKLSWGNTSTGTTVSVSGAAFPSTKYWGNAYTIPAGQGTGSSKGSMFEITSISIIAREAGTTVSVDYDRNGTADASGTIGEGETFYVDSRTASGTALTSGTTLSANVLDGATITTNKPVQVMYMTGNQGTAAGSSLWGGRTFPLVPDIQLSTCYVVPAVYGISRRLFFYNPSGSSITITRTAPGGTTTTFSVGANSLVSAGFTTADQNGYQYCSGSAAFAMLACADDDGIVSDWGFVPTSQANLQKIALMSLGFGQDPTSATTQTRNYSQLLVTPTSNTYFYVDFNGDKIPDKFCIGQNNLNVTETSVSIGTGTYNEATSDNGVLVNAFNTLSISSPTGNMAGAYVWTKTTTGNGGTYGGDFAAIWGQNDGSAVGDPNIDAGYNLPPKVLPPLNTNVRVRFPEVCPGSVTDTIHFNITGGTPPYRIQWINLSTGVNSVYSYNADSTKIGGITPGNYVVKIRDNNCLDFQTSVVITQKTTGCPQIISGRVYNDGDGNYDGAIDGTNLGNPEGTQLYAYLDSVGIAVRKFTLPTSGVNTGYYSFSAAASTNYTVVISATSVTVGASTPGSANLPGNWETTGEQFGSANGAGTGLEDPTAPFTSNGRIAVTTGSGSTNVTNVNFGINKRPESSDLTMSPQNNPGIGNQVTVGTLSGTDNEDGSKGSGNTLVITSLGVNGTVYYNGVAVTLNQVITSYNPALLTVAPNFSGAGSVTFTYAWRDAASFDDLTPATVEVPFLGSLSGTVFNDGDGLSDATVDGTGLGNPSATTLYANLINNGTGNVVATVAVNTNGTYSFNGLAAATYSVQVSTNQGTVGSTPPATDLPNTNWVNTGENLGAAAGNDGSVNGTLTPIALSTVALTNANFGINERPTSDNKVAPSQLNPGGTVQVQAPALSGNDREDLTKGSGNTFRITSLGVNGTVYYNGTAVTLNQVISNYDATLLTVDPTFTGPGNVQFTYAWIDNAGFEDLTPATVTLQFTGLSISGTVYLDPDGLTDNDVDGTGQGSFGSASNNLRAYLINGSGIILAVQALASNGTYSFNNRADANSSYSVLITRQLLTVGTSAPSSSSLPDNFVHVGEDYGSNNAAGSGIVSTTPDGFNSANTGTSNVTGVDFGIEYATFAHDKTYSVNPDDITGLTGHPTYTRWVPLYDVTGTNDTTFNSGLGMPGKVSGFDLEDGRFDGTSGNSISGSIRRFVINTLPSAGNGLLRYNNVDLIPSPVNTDPSWVYWNSTLSRYEIPNFDASQLKLMLAFVNQNNTSFNYSYIDAAGIGGRIATYTLDYTVPLPVHILSFKGRKAGDMAVLDWKVTGEDGITGYQIWRSNGSGNSVLINTQSAKGIMAGVSAYQCTDDLSKLSAGTYIYELKYIETNGLAKKGGVAVIAWDNAVNTAVSLVPNPADQYFDIMVDAESAQGVVKVSLTDVNGRLVTEQSFNGTTNRINTWGLQEGVYNVNVQSEGLSKSFKIVVLHP